MSEEKINKLIGDPQDRFGGSLKKLFGDSPLGSDMAETIIDELSEEQLDELLNLAGVDFGEFDARLNKTLAEYLPDDGPDEDQGPTNDM